MTAKLRLRPWKPGDQDAFTPRDDFAAERRLVGWDWSAGAPGPTWAVCRWSGEVVGVAGFYLGADGADAWACLAELPRRDWPQLLWLAEREIGRMRDAGRASAFRVFVRAGFEAGRRCLERLGFAERTISADGRYVVMIRSA